MAITKISPQTIWLGGQKTLVDEYAATAIITPGMLIAMTDNSGLPGYAPHSDADGPAPTVVALERIMLNKTIDDNYAVGDMVEAGALSHGSVFYGILPSGENVIPGTILQSNGDGKLKVVDSGEGKYIAQETVNPVADARCRVEVQG